MAALPSDDLNLTIEKEIQSTSCLFSSPSRRVIYNSDLVLEFPRRNGGEKTTVAAFTQSRYVELMLGLKNGEEYALTAVFKSDRCFLGQMNDSNISLPQKIAILQREFIELVTPSMIHQVDDEPTTTEVIFCELVAKSIARRIQRACGLTTNLFLNKDEDKILMTIKADERDLCVEAERSRYRLQTRNKPFAACHTKSNASLRKQFGSSIVDESARHLRKMRFKAQANMDIPEMDPLLLTHGSLYHPVLFDALKRLWHHSELADDSPQTWWQAFRSTYMEISKQNDTYFSLHTPYQSTKKFQPYYRHYALNHTAVAREQSSMDESLFRQVDRIRLVSRIIHRHINEGALLEMKYLASPMFALHDDKALMNLKHSWALNPKLITQPINSIRDYFGEKIALYFAWLEFYTKMLIIPSAVGIVSYFFSHSVYYKIAFSIGVVLWSTCFTEVWKRKNALYNAAWGVAPSDINAHPRAQFRGIKRLHPMDDSPQIWHDSHDAITRRRWISYLVIVVMVLIVCLSLAGLFLLKRQSLTWEHPLAKDYGSYGVSVLNSIQINLFNYVYWIIAERLNQWENHRTDVHYEYHLVIKVFLFQFCNSFASFFYIAFIKQVVGDPCAYNGDCLAELQSQLIILFIMQFVMGNVIELLYPFSCAFIRRFQGNLKGDSTNQRNLHRAEKQAALNPYGDAESFYDYNEIVLQYGFVTLFVVAFPLLPVLALISNIFEIHIDAFKICVGHRRPFPRRAVSIGVWHFFLQAMSALAIATNVGIVLFTNDPSNVLDIPIQSKWVVFLIAEHIGLLFQFTITRLLPDVPRQLEIWLARQEEIENHVFLGVESTKIETLSEIAENEDLNIHPSHSKVYRASSMSMNESAKAT